MSDANTKVLYKVGDKVEYINTKGVPIKSDTWGPPLIISRIIFNHNNHPIYYASTNGRGFQGGFTNDMIRPLIPEINEAKLKKVLKLE